MKVQTYKYIYLPARKYVFQHDCLPHLTDHLRNKCQLHCKQHALKKLAVFVHQTNLYPFHL